MRNWAFIFGCITVILCISIFSASIVFAVDEIKKPENQVQTIQKPTILKLTTPTTGPSKKNNVTNALSYDFKINKLSDSDDLFKLDKPVSIPKNTPLDKNGITVDIVNGKTYDHPVRLAQYSILFLNSFKLTNNPIYLKKSELQAQRLYSIATKKNNMLIFPYEFDDYLHNIKSEHLQPPWYSGMSQGLALSAFTRLYEVTKDKKYLTWAKLTFNSFREVKSAHSSPKVWVSMIDNQDYFWIEEYPLDPPTHVLNGFIFAIGGLYDYYELTNDPLVKNYLQSTLTTIYDHIYLYRVPGGPSRYGLYLLNQSEHYHFVHMQQLHFLYKMTGEQYFMDVQKVFYTDFNKNSYKTSRKLSFSRRLKNKVKVLLHNIAS